MSASRSLTVLSTLAVMGVLQEVLPEYERANGLVARTSFGPTKELLGRIEGGARADVTILTETGIEALIAAGTLAAGSRVDLSRSFVGVAVRAGAPQPAIGTAEAFRQALLDARSIAYSAAKAASRRRKMIARRVELRRATFRRRPAVVSKVVRVPNYPIQRIRRSPV